MMNKTINLFFFGCLAWTLSYAQPHDLVRQNIAYVDSIRGVLRSQWCQGDLRYRTNDTLPVKRSRFLIPGILNGILAPSFRLSQLDALLHRLPKDNYTRHETN